MSKFHENSKDMILYVEKYINVWYNKPKDKLRKKFIAKVMEIFEGILARRSVRLYDCKPIEPESLNKIIQSAIWAPSGKNGQPWKFKIITDKNIIGEISKLSINARWLKTAPCLIFIYLDKTHSYHYVKDIQSCGAAIQNMLLTAYEMGIGSCWIGDLLEKADAVNKLLQVDDCLELMGVVSFGYGRGEPINVGRKDINEFLI